MRKPMLPLALLWTLLPLAAPAQTAEETIVGRGEFLRSCAACHGEDAKGGGPAARFLNVPPPDLTGLAERNGGEFPFMKIFEVIDGRAATGVHGSREMPVWGNRYRAEAAAAGAGQAEQVARGRILELVNYLQAIQEPGMEGRIIGRGQGSISRARLGRHDEPRSRHAAS